MKKCNLCGRIPTAAWLERKDTRCELHAHPTLSCDGVLRSEKELFLEWAGHQVLRCTTPEQFKDFVAKLVRMSLDTIGDLEERLDAKNPSSDAKCPDQTREAP